MRTTGEKIKLARVAQLMTQAQLAEKIDRSECIVNLYENNRRPPSRVSMLNLARSLDVSIDWLMGVNE